MALTSGLTGAVLALGIVAVIGLDGRVTERVVERVPVDDAVDDLRSKSGTSGIPAVAQTVSPSVVRVDATTGSDVVTGSGVVVRDDGTIVTNAHVVADADTVTIVLPDGTGLHGRVVGADRLTDIAVVVVDDADAHAVTWEPAVLGSADDLEVGEPAIAIGSPLGLTGSPSVTAGVVSGLRRRVAADGVVLHDMIQTDAPIARGSSGGALCDGSGVVVGITTALATTGSGPDGIGFAVTIDVAREVVEELLAGNGVRWSWLGIEGGDAADADSAAGSGVRVVAVDPGGPASTAGIAADDVIVVLDGEPIASMADLIVALRSRRPGDVVTVRVLRGGAAVAVEVTLGERP